MSAARKVFHCAVDDTVLTTNISEIKRWASSGAITLFVPLYTLERLQAPKRGGSQVAINSREAVRFLDRVTSGKDSIPSERIILQGPMEQYDNWADAEQYFLPEFEDEVDEENATTTGDGDIVSTPKAEIGAKAHAISSRESEQKGHGLPGLPSDLSQMLLSKLNFKEPEPVANILKSSISVPSVGTQSDEGSRASSRSSRTSPEYADRNGATHPERGHHRSTSTSSNTPLTPTTLRPLLSSLLWRLHQNQGSPGAVLQNLILVSNDRDIQIWAQKFGIATKNIHQLRTAIQYEEKEFKNRVKYVEKTHHVAPTPKPLFSYDNNESEEDELVFVPRGRGKGTARSATSRGANSRKSRAAAAAAIAQADTTIEVPSQPIDPDSFSRSIGATMTVKQPALDLSSQHGASRGLAAASRRHGGDQGNANANGNGSGGSSSRRRQRGTGGSRTSPSARGGRGQGKLWVP